MLLNAQEIDKIVKCNFKFYEEISSNYDGKYIIEVWYSKLMNDYDIAFVEQDNENVGFAILQTIRKQRNSVPEQLKKSGTKQLLFVNVKNNKPVKKEKWYIEKARKSIAKGKDSRAITQIRKGLKAYPYSTELLSLKISILIKEGEESAETIADKILLERINNSMWEPVYLYVNQFFGREKTQREPSCKKQEKSLFK